MQRRWNSSFSFYFFWLRVWKGRLESYRMTDEEASSGMGKTEASSILAAMHHGMWMVEGQQAG